MTVTAPAIALASIVIYKNDPLMYGRMIVAGTRRDPATITVRYICESVHKDKDGKYAREIFDQGELEPASTWQPDLELPVTVDGPGATP